MKKQDYAILAEVIREKLRLTLCSTSSRDIRELALMLADRLSVDKQTFLKACGVE